MAERYIAFDVETPNHINDRMSAIGLTVVEGGMVIEEFSTLVDPEVCFEPFNIRLTGITPEAAQQSPAFPELWEEVCPLLESGLLVAHNAPFDMGVLSKCLQAYGIYWRQWADYACTVQMGRRRYPDLPDHRLDTLCAYLDIPLDHHRAGSDSRACAELLIDYMDHGLDPEQFRRHYRMVR